MSAQTPAKITLEEITQRKKKLLNEIHAQKRAMTATDRKSTRLNSSHTRPSRMPSSA